MSFFLPTESSRLLALLLRWDHVWHLWDSGTEHSIS
jgi:hypothetical protein